MGRNWRTGDLRGDPGSPSSVVRVVQRAWFGLAVARGGESVLLAAAALCLILGAATLSGDSLSGPQVWLAALTGATLCGASWWLEHRRAPEDIARRIDDQLRHQGALFTAYELELQGDRRPLSRLLAERVLVRLRLRDARRAVHPTLVVPVVVPLVSVVILAVCLERTRTPEPPNPLIITADGLVQGLGGLRSEAVSSGPELGREAAALAAEGQRLARVLEGPDSPERRRALEDAAALDERLAELALKARDEPKLRAAVAESRTWLDALRQALERDQAPPAGGPDAGDPGASGGEPQGGPGGDSGGEPTGAGPDGVTPGSGDGKMPSSSNPGEDAADPPSAVPGAAEVGAAGGDWWPAEYDEVVRRWLQRTGGSAGDEPR